MSEEKNKNQQPKSTPSYDKRPGVNIEKGRSDEQINREGPSPRSWQPVRDQTDPTPPDGGSGSGEN